MRILLKHIIKIVSVLLLLFTWSCKKDDLSSLNDRGVAVNFAVKEGTVQENNTEGIPINIAFLAPTAEAGTVAIEILPEEGLVYGTDFTTDPDGSSGMITLTIPKGSTEASFTIFPENKLGENSTKSLALKLKSATGGVFIGTQKDFTLYITDEPIIQITGDLTDFGDIEQGFPSASQSYTVSVVSLVDNLEIVAPTDYELSNDDANFSSTLSLAAVDFIDNEATVYVRLAPSTSSTLGVSGGDITHSTTGAVDKMQAVTGTVIATIPVIIIDESLTDFGSVSIGQQSSSKNFTVEGHALTANVEVTSPANFEVSADDVIFSASITLDYTAIEGNPTLVYVRFSPTVVGPISESVTLTSDGAAAGNITVTGTGDAFVVIAFTSFEEPTIGVDYVDTELNNVDHDLVNNSGQNVVDYTSTGGEIGYDATFVFTREYTTPVNMDLNGVVSELTEVGTFIDGAQGYKIMDAEGLYKLTFDQVDITGFSSVSLTLDLFINESTYEVSTYGGTVDVADAIRIYVIVDGGVELDLFNEDANGNLDDDILVLKDIWQELEIDLTGYTTVKLVIETDTNITSEGFFIDNLKIKGSN